MNKIISFKLKKGKKRDTMSDQKSNIANLRLFASIYAEFYYVIQNFIDHLIDFRESSNSGQKYLPARMQQYKGQKKIAFLYHGYFQGTVGYERLESILESELFNIFAISGTYQPYSQDIRKSAEYEMKVLEWVINNTDAEEVYLIGHSQGGLVVRYMIQFLGADKLIDKAIFLATPHRGTHLAMGSGLNKAAMTIFHKILPGFPKIEGDSAKQMRPNSQFIRRLNAKNLPKGVDYTSIYSYIDPIVWPSTSARLPYREANNILLRKIGHMQPLYDFQSIEIILKTLLLNSNRLKDGSLVNANHIYEKRKIKNSKGEFHEVVTF